MEYDSDNCYGLNWTKWVPFSEDFRNSDTITSPGLYRIKESASGKLMYVGQTGRNLRERVGGLCRNTLKNKAPWNDPHTAAPRLWSYKKEKKWSFSFSVAEYLGEKRSRLMIESALLSACRSETGVSPICNFGRMHPRWSSPTNRNKGVPCKRFDLDKSEEFSDSIDYSTFPQMKYPEWGLNPWVKLGYSTINYNSQAVYLLLNNSEVVYIGETKSLRSRILSHKKKFSFGCVWYHPLPNHYSKPQRLELENDLLAEFWVNKKEIPDFQFRPHKV
jgi:hypothetical protein